MANRQASYTEGALARGRTLTNDHPSRRHPYPFLSEGTLIRTEFNSSIQCSTLMFSHLTSRDPTSKSLFVISPLVTDCSTSRISDFRGFHRMDHGDPYGTFLNLSVSTSVLVSDSSPGISTRIPPYWALHILVSTISSSARSIFLLAKSMISAYDHPYHA